MAQRITFVVPRQEVLKAMGRVGHTQASLGRKLGYSTRTVWAFMHERPISEQYARAIAAVIGIDLDAVGQRMMRTPTTPQGAAA